ncbi:MAG: hypothetical protein LBD24_05040 [Spirochaetaceae bacterium]|nr:hypothetical protein [Spirochaetaceae bacterium]
MIHIGDFFYADDNEKKVVVRDITKVAGIQYVTVRVYRMPDSDDGEDSCAGCLSEDEVMEYREQVLRFNEDREDITLDAIRRVLGREV